MLRTIVSALRPRSALPPQQDTVPAPRLLPVRLLNERVVFPYRRAQLTRRLTPFLQGVRSALDVGASDGHLAHRLVQTTGCHITGIDVCLQPRAYIDVHSYDGKTFPFDDNTFDCVLMVDMLHHTTDMEQVLSEARRVARHFILIKDHYWDTHADTVALSVADYLGNAPYNIPLPYNYLRLNEWERLFRRLDLRAINHSAFRYNRLDSLKHIIVKLRTH